MAYYYTRWIFNDVSVIEEAVALLSLSPVNCCAGECTLIHQCKYIAQPHDGSPFSSTLVSCSRTRTCN